MSTGLVVTLVAVALLAALTLVLVVRRRRPLPCPACAAFLLENRWMEKHAGSRLLLDRARVEPGMRVLDVGCGPGRLTLPAAERVGSEGAVVALDVQEGMLEKLRVRLEEREIDNVRIIHAGVGEGKLEETGFDRAFLVTVLGEIRDKPAALAEIFAALAPGGILSVTEMLPDPDYQPRDKVRRLAEAAGFRVCDSFGSLFAFTLNFVRPSEAVG